jgi:hypothetical protein
MPPINYNKLLSTVKLVVLMVAKYFLTLRKTTEIEFRKKLRTDKVGSSFCTGVQILLFSCSYLKMYTLKCRTASSPVILCGCESWSLTLSKGSRL